ncbi:MAG: O-antigen ligase family protein [Desulfobulbaceae bacterium]|nr:O-antigen ligase family protein [Desulfobulbaceae bacterium]
MRWEKIAYINTIQPEAVAGEGLNLLWSATGRRGTKTPRKERVYMEIMTAGRKSLLQKIQHTATLSIDWFAVMLAFSIPLSTSAVSVLAVLILTAWIIGGDYSRKWAVITKNPVSLALLFYLGLFFLGLLWTQNISTGLEMIEKQWKLLLFPVLLSSLVYSHRRRYVVSFLAGLTVAMLLTYLAWFDILHYGGVTPEHLTRRLFHVVYNPLLAFGFYMVCHEVLWGKRSGIGRLVLILLAGCMAVDMFITEGRTGQVVFFVLLGLLFIQFFSRSKLKAVLFILLILPLTFAAGYQLSPTFQNRVDAAGQEIREFNENPNTSVGLRLLFWKNSWRIIRAHPLFGVGTGDFQSSYAEVNAELSPDMVATDNPHNQYVFILCQFGILGLLSLLTIFFAQIHQAVTCKDDWRRIRIAFPVFFLTIMLAESYLVIYETGFFFALFSAVLFARPGKSAESSAAPGEEQ